MFERVALPSLTPFGLRYQRVTSWSPIRFGLARLIRRARRLARAGKSVAWTFCQIVAARCSKVGRSGAVAAEISPDPRYRFWVITVSRGGRLVLASAAGAAARTTVSATMARMARLTHQFLPVREGDCKCRVRELGGALPG